MNFAASSVQQNAGDLPTAKDSALDLAASPRDIDLRCAFYCEENVWRLAHRKMCTTTKQRNHAFSYYVVFISNESKSVPMFHQLASQSPEDTPCVWDYHVILLGFDPEIGEVWVYDVDTTLTPYPLPLDHYLSRSFSDQLTETPFAPLFRVVQASLFLRYFQSDRSHMYNSHTHRWSAPPPPYQCILSPNQSSAASSAADSSTGTRNNLNDFLNFGAPRADRDIPTEALGVIMTLEQLSHYNFQ